MRASSAQENPLSPLPPPATEGRASITITAKNAPEGGFYSIGDVMRFDIVVTNTDTVARSFAPAKTNLSGEITRCRWRNIPAGGTKTDCAGLATHVVTAEDIARGSFTPMVAYEVKDVEYAGAALAEPEEVTGTPVPVKAAALRVESLTLTSAPQDSYKVGDSVSYTVRVRSVSDRIIDVAATGSSFDDLGSQCAWRNLAPGPGAVYNCKTLTHVFTSADADTGNWTPSIILTASAQGEELQRLSASGTALTVLGDHPQAIPSPAPDVNPDLDASMSEAVRLAANTGTDNYRIPAITTAPNGDLLVSYDERPKDNGNGGSDSPNPNHIVQRRSTDGGITWSAPTYIRKGTETGLKVGYSDPSYLVDDATGTIFNFHVKSYDQGWPGSRPGTNPEDRSVIHAEVSASTDNGWTWTHRTITADITPDPAWTARFAASGQGIRIRHGAHAGRLVQQYTIKTTSGHVQAVSVYSDDHGQTWRAGQAVGSGMDENKVVELSDGTLMLNSRVSDASGYRKIAWSHDGGHTWTGLRSDPHLPDSVDNAQIIRAFPNAEPSDPRAKILLLSHSPNPRPWSRDRGTISMSCDDGETWAASRIFNEAFVGYTTIAVQNNGTIGLLSEDGNYGGIWYRNFTTKWVSDLCFAPHASARADSATVYPGADALVSVTVSNPTDHPLTGVAVGAPTSEALSFIPSGEAPKQIAAGQHAVYTFTLRSSGEFAQVHAQFPVTWEGGSTEATLTLDSSPGPQIHPEAIGADSEERVGETPPNGPATAAVDGDPLTFWHTQWRDAAPGFDPNTGHWIDLKVADADMTGGEAPLLATLNYMARQGVDMGRAKDYRIFVSEDGVTWSEEPVVVGVLQNTAQMQRIPLNIRSRYLRFMVMNNYSSGNDAHFLVAAEISLTLDARSADRGEEPRGDTPEPPARADKPTPPAVDTPAHSPATMTAPAASLAHTGVSSLTILGALAVMVLGIGVLLRRRVQF